MYSDSSETRTMYSSEKLKEFGQEFINGIATGRLP